MMKNDWAQAALAKLALAVATAATIGGGTAVLNSASTNAVQNQRLTTLEADRQEMHELSQKLDETNRNVAVLNERLTYEIKK